MADKYISVDAVKDICVSLISNYDLYDREQAFCIAAINRVADTVEKAPAADVVERKKGEWIENEIVTYLFDGEKYATAYSFYCSNCGKTVVEKGNFCPNCGAEMGHNT